MKTSSETNLSAILRKEIHRPILLTIFLIFPISFMVVLHTITMFSKTLVHSQARTSAEYIAWTVMTYMEISKEVARNEVIFSDSHDVEQKKAFLAEICREKNIRQSQILDKRGFSIMDGHYRGNREYFVEALKGNTTISDPLISKTDGKIGITIATPVWKDGTPSYDKTLITGVLFMTIDTEVIDSSMANTKFSSKSTVYILGRNGTVVASEHSENGMRLTSQNQGKGDRSLRQLAAAGKNTTEGDSRLFFINRSAGILGYSPVPNTKTWVFCIYTPLSEFLPVFGTGYALIVIISAVFIVILLSLSKKITKAITSKIKSFYIQTQTVLDEDKSSFEKKVEKAKMEAEKNTESLKDKKDKVSRDIEITESFKNMESITDFISEKVLQEMMELFSQKTEAAALITRPDGTAVTAVVNTRRFCTHFTKKSNIGCQNCALSDKNGARMAFEADKPVLYKCHTGLTDFTAPIMLNGKILGYIVGGQMRGSDLDTEKILECAEKYGIDKDKYMEEISRIPVTSEEEMKKIEGNLKKVSEIISKLAEENLKISIQNKKITEAGKKNVSKLVEMDSLMTSKLREWIPKAKIAMENGKTRAIKELMKKLIEVGSDTLELATESLEYAKLTDLCDGIREVKYSPYEVSRNVYESIEQSIPAEVQFNFAPADNLSKILLGDSGRIFQLMSMMLLNALTFTETGSISFSVTTEKKRYSTILSITVSDTGLGMTPKQLEEARFMLSHDQIIDNSMEAERMKFSAFSKIVRQLSGKAEIFSERGSGTRVSISIPQIEIQSEVEDEVV